MPTNSTVTPEIPYSSTRSSSTASNAVELKTELEPVPSTDSFAERIRADANRESVVYVLTSSVQHSGE